MSDLLSDADLLTRLIETANDFADEHDTYGSGFVTGLYLGATMPAERMAPIVSAMRNVSRFRRAAKSPPANDIPA